jgi:hypothetical protein
MDCCCYTSIFFLDCDVPVPTLLNFEQDMRKLMTLQEENEALKTQVS